MSMLCCQIKSANHKICPNTSVRKATHIHPYRHTLIYDLKIFRKVDKILAKLLTLLLAIKTEKGAKGFLFSTFYTSQLL